MTFFFQFTQRAEGVMSLLVPDQQDPNNRFISRMDGFNVMFDGDYTCPDGHIIKHGTFQVFSLQGEEPLAESPYYRLSVQDADGLWHEVARFDVEGSEEE